MKMVNGKDDSLYSFNGDIWYNRFVKVSKPSLLPSGRPYLDSGYTWMEFYDFSSKNRLTAMYDENNNIVEWYYDIARKTGKNQFEYTIRRRRRCVMQSLFYFYSYNYYLHGIY
jgi:hypothetical protein